MQRSQIMGLRTATSQYGEESNVIDLAGCFAFSVKNTGNIRAFIFGNMPLNPGEFMSFANIDGLPYVNDINLDFAREVRDSGGIKQVTVVKTLPVAVDHVIDKGLI